MALPNQINPALPAASDPISEGDDQIRALKQALIDIFGIPNAVSITTALMAFNTSGALTAGLTFDLGVDGNILAAKRGGTVVWSIYADDAEPKLVIRDSSSTARFYIDLTTGAVTVVSLTALNGVIASGGIDAGGSGIFLKTKVIDIGNWNMAASSSVNVAHGLTLSNIRRVSAAVRNDTATQTINLNFNIGGESGSQGVYAEATNIVLHRSTAGTFDSSSFSAASYNRGWIVIDYI